MDQLPPMYLLTEYTGRPAKDDTTHMIGRYQVSTRTFYLIIAFFVLSTVMAAISSPLIKALAILWYPIVFGLGFWLANARDHDGLRQRKWQSIKDRRASHENDYLMGDEVLDVGASEYDTVVLLDIDLETDDENRPVRSAHQMLEMTP